MQVGIWERNEGIFDAVQASLSSRGDVVLLRGGHPADFLERQLDLLCISPAATGWAGANAVDCRMLLLPGAAGPLARGLHCACAVSYGTSPKDTLTFSSLEGSQICVALQRELVTLAGGVVDRQELVLPFPAGAAPLPYLAAVGVELLLGVAAEELGSGSTAFSRKVTGRIPSVQQTTLMPSRFCHGVQVPPQESAETEQ